MPFSPKKLFITGPLACLSLFSSAQTKSDFIYQSPSFSISKSEVIQGNYKAKANSATEITSNYQSPVNEFLTPRISLKFSINGKDNEMVSGKDHQINIRAVNGKFVSPLIQFGHQYVDNSPTSSFLKQNTTLVLRLDMNDVFSQFRNKGYYTTFNGDKVYKEDFKGVYVAGSINPLTWDFPNLVNHPRLRLNDPDGDHIYEVTLVLNQPEDKKETASSWKLSSNISAFPQYKSSNTLSDALYNLSLEEMQKAIEPDSTFRTGKEWAGVWTRDISYSIILSMAILQPKVAAYSLMRKVKNERVIQDTGTGGSYPVSSDRMIWAVAAWELYKTTGDKDWLTKAFRIIRNSVEDDLKIVFDPETGLFRGESSFLDWREQTYAKWMQPADIYQSECLGTNAVHFQVNTVLSMMAKELNDPQSERKYKNIAEIIKRGINKYLWMPEKGYYGQYLYGRNFKILSPRSEALGEALCILFGIADSTKQKSIIENTPVNNYGIPCIYPQIPDIPPYHNNAVWPFVQAYWALATAKAGNENALVQSIASIYRPIALFLTDKENFVASNGDFAGTQINSDNMLWTLSGNLSVVYKVLFGIDFFPDKITFRPSVPKSMGVSHSLTNFRYRNAILDIEIEGHGNQIRSVLMDGEPLLSAELPATITGEHKIQIVLVDNQEDGGRVNLVDHAISPQTPAVSFAKNKLQWNKVAGAVKYKIIRNGADIFTTTATSFQQTRGNYAEYQVIAIDKHGLESFASEPLQVYNSHDAKIIELETFAARSPYDYKGYSGSGFIEISKTKNKHLEIKIPIAEDGIYAIDFKYANGNGPVNTENKCAVRTLQAGNNTSPIVFPQRGKDEWSDWGYTNSVVLKLKKGQHIVTLDYLPENENMNGEVNQAMLDYLRVIKLNKGMSLTDKKIQLSQKPL